MHWDKSARTKEVLTRLSGDVLFRDWLEEILLREMEALVFERDATEVVRRQAVCGFIKDFMDQLSAASRGREV